MAARVDAPVGRTGRRVALSRMFYESDVRDVLGTIRVPDLVLSRAGGEMEDARRKRSRRSFRAHGGETMPGTAPTVMQEHVRSLRRCDRVVRAPELHEEEARARERARDGALHRHRRLDRATGGDRRPTVGGARARTITPSYAAASLAIAAASSTRRAERVLRRVRRPGPRDPLRAVPSWRAYGRSGSTVRAGLHTRGMPIDRREDRRSRGFDRRTGECARGAVGGARVADGPRPRRRLGAASSPTAASTTSRACPGAWRVYAVGRTAGLGIAATPGSTLPSSSSSEAPPPVETHDRRRRARAPRGRARNRRRRRRCTRLPRRPPPRRPSCPSAKRAHSKTPIGPFQNTVFAPRGSRGEARASRGRCRARASPPAASSYGARPASRRPRRRRGRDDVGRSSTGNGSGSSSRSCSAIFPPTSTVSALPPRFSSTPSLSSTFAPPATSTNGRSTSPSSLPRFSSSALEQQPRVGGQQVRDAPRWTHARGAPSRTRRSRRDRMPSASSRANCRVVLRLAGDEARVLEHPDPVVRQELARAVPPRARSRSRVGAFRPAEVRADAHLGCAALEQELERRQGRADPRVVGDVAVLERDVEVGAHEDRLPATSASSTERGSAQHAASGSSSSTRSTSRHE